MNNQDWSPVTLKKTPSISQIKNMAKKITDDAKSKILTAKSRSDMAVARVAKGLTQKQLDSSGFFPAGSCNSWESGRTCPSGPQIDKLHRVLGIKLERE